MATGSLRAGADHSERATVFKSFARETIDVALRNDLLSRARGYEALAATVKRQALFSPIAEPAPPAWAVARID